MNLLYNNFALKKKIFCVKHYIYSRINVDVQHKVFFGRKFNLFLTFLGNYISNIQF